MPDEVRRGQGHTLLSVLQGSRIGVLAADAAGTVAHAHAALWSRTGFAADELARLPLARLPLWHLPAPSGEQFLQALAKGQAWQGGLVLRHRDGQLMSPAVDLLPVPLRMGGVGGFLDLQAARTQAGANRLLIVDDEPNILSALRRLLRHEGYEIHTAASGTEALEVLALEPVQVVVSDQRMPGMSGTEFLGHVNSMYPQTVRIAMAGYADLTAVTEAVNQGAIYRSVSKPWNDEDLKAALQAAFRHWRADTGPREVRPAELEASGHEPCPFTARHGARPCSN